MTISLLDAPAILTAGEMFDKNFLLDGKSIRNEKNTVKEKNRDKGKGTKG